MFTLTDEQKMIQQTVRSFVEKELMPYEQQVLHNERNGRPGMSRNEIRQLQLKAKEAGFWGINTPEEYGGANLGPVMTALIQMELGRTFVPFHFGGSADNILYASNKEQQDKYLWPVINGDLRSCFAISEPGAGSDAANIKMPAVKDGNHWILNGEKIFITNGNEADFAMFFAVSYEEKCTHDGGVTFFLVERDMEWKSEYIQTMGEWGPASLVFDNVRVPEENILGELGGGFKLAMQWIGQGRWTIPANGVGAAERLLQMGIEQAKSRITFGKPIADRQAIQWMLADSDVEIDAAKWLVLRAAWLAENNKDNRHQSSRAKLFGTNMANKVVDRILQIHGGMGYTKELPI